MGTTEAEVDTGNGITQQGLKEVALAMAKSFERMRREESLEKVLYKAEDIDPQLVAPVRNSIALMERAAIAFAADEITMLEARRVFERAIPAMMRFALLSDLDHQPRSGVPRTLPLKLADAVEAYHYKKSMANTYRVIDETLHANMSTSWMFDNTARAVVFCYNAQKEKMKLAC